MATGKELEQGGSETGYMHMSLSPDGRTVAVAGGDLWNRNDTIHLWDAVTGKVVGELREEQVYVSALAFSPRGRLLAAVGQVQFSHSTISLWDTQTGKLLGHLGRQEAATPFVTFSPDGRRLATAGNSVHIWDLATGKEVQTLQGHEQIVQSAAFAPDGHVLATASADGTLRLWDLAMGTQTRCWIGHGGYSVTGVAFSPNGETLASVGRDGFLALWDARTGRLRRHMPTSRDSGWGLAFAPDGTAVACGDGARAFSIWETTTGNRRYRIDGHKNFVTSLAFSTDGKTLVTASEDGTALVWDVTRLKNSPAAATPPRARADWYGDPLPADAQARLGSVRLRHESTVTALAFAPDGKTLAAGSAGNAGTSLRWWDVATGKELRRFQAYPGRMEQVAFSVDGRTLAASSSEGALVWNAVTGQRLWSFNGRLDSIHDLQATALSPDGNFLAGGFRDYPPGVRDNPIVLWDLRTGQEAGRLMGPNTEVKGLAFSADGKRLLASSRDAIHAWDMVTRKLWRERTVREGPVTFSPDGKTVALAADKNTSMWDLERDQLRYTVATVGGACAFSPDGKTLAAVNDRENLGLWDVATGRELRRFPEHSGQGCLHLCFSPDGTTLAASYGAAIRLWNVATGQERHPFVRHAGAVRCLAYAPDGRTIRSAGDDGTVRLWETQTGKPLLQYPLALEGTDVLAFAPDGKRMVRGDASNTLHVWDAASGKELRHWTVPAAPLGPSYPQDVSGLAFFPDGKTLLSASRDDMIRLWDADTGKELRRWKGGTPVAVSGDGQVVATTGNAAMRLSEEGSTIHLWSVHPWMELGRITGGSSEGYGALCLSPDGKLLVASSYFMDQFHGMAQPTGLQVFEVATRKKIFSVETATLPLAFSPDGRWLIAGTIPRSFSGPPAISLLDLARGRAVGQVTGHLDAVVALAFAPDGRTFASGSADGTILVWDAAACQRHHGQQPAELTPGELAGLWAKLAARDPAEGFRALRSLITAPKQAVPYLRDHLQPVPAAGWNRIAQWVADLNDPHFAVRQRATEELTRLGPTAEPALRQALAGRPSLEVLQRITRLLQGLKEGPPPDALRSSRAIMGLEYLGTPEARQVLQKLATGAPDAPQTADARAALERLRHGR